MSATAAIPELDEVIHYGSPCRRATMVARLSAFFLDGASRFHDDHVKVFDQVLSRLVSEIETKARAELSQQLAAVGNAPVEVVRQLARDEEIEVARPVLEQSARLSDSDLVHIARIRSQAHLLAIASRPEIAAPVTDLLVRRGDRQVARTLAENHGARLSADGFARLVGRAQTDELLAEKIANRPDFPSRLLPELVLEVTQAVQQRLPASTKTGSETAIRTLLAQASENADALAAPRDYTAAQRLIESLRREQRLNEAATLDFVKNRRFEETVVALACLCAVPIEVVERILDCDRPDPVLILCKAAGWEWPTAKEIIMATRPTQTLSSQSLDAAHTNFEYLSPATAKRVMRFWQVKTIDDGR
jgi:uncharacterized protein (DUF2336 family)